MTSSTTILPAPTPRAGLRAALRRPVLPVLIGLLMVALVSGGVWTATAKTASVAVDGAAREVDFRGDTVADALEAAGLTVGEHDQVVPSADTDLDDGGRVALRRGRQLTLVVDGQERTVWVTAASVDEALDQVGLRDEGLLLSASRSRDIPLEGIRLEVTTPKSLTILVDGTSVVRSTTAPTVAAALTEAGIVVDADDRLSVAATEPVTTGMSLQVVRVTVERSEVEKAVPFATERRDDPELLVGQTKTVTPGKPGVQRLTLDKVTADGVVEGTNVVATTDVTAPVAKVVAVGTKPKPAAAPRVAAPASPEPAAEGPRSSTGSAESLNWNALAQCESGGNPRAVNPSGTYRGLYQFSLQTWRGVGGSGDPIDASPGEQTYRAQLLYNRSGAGQWPSCGRRLFT